MSDDLFLYAKRRVSGLRSNTFYTVTFNLSFATSAFEVGGRGMVVKAGASATEANTVLLGDLTKPNQNSGDFEIKTLGSPQSVVVRSDANGEAWILDSAFEVDTIVYLTRVHATFRP